MGRVSEAARVGDLANRMFVTAPFPSTDDRSVPGIAKYHEEVDAAGVENSTAVRRLAGLNAWLSAHAAMEVAESIEGEITRGSVTAALQRASGAGPVRRPGHLQPAGAGWSVGLFARFPESDYHVLTFESPTMVDTGRQPVPGPLQTVRTS